MHTEVLIIGGGIAGQSVCEEIASARPGTKITMVCEEPRYPFDRVSLSHLLVDGKDASELQIRPEAWYEDHNVSVLLGVTVSDLDAQKRSATISGGAHDGLQISFERAVLCTGSEAFMPPIPGIESEGVIAFRGPEDCEAIRTAALAGQDVAVIGGGLLGLEAAYGVASQGAKATVIHLMDRLMERQLDVQAAQMLEPAFQELGVEVLLEHSTTKIENSDGLITVSFDNGDQISCGLLVVAVGIKSRTALAQKIGAECERGIVVDDQLRTSLPAIFSVGECAQHRGNVYGIVAPIHEQAVIAAKVIAGELNGASGSDASSAIAAAAGAAASYEGSLLSAKLKVMGIDLVSIGQAEGNGGATTLDVSEGVYRKLVLQDGKLVGAILMGDTRGYELLLDQAKGDTDVEDPLELLVSASQASAGDLPDTAQICNCNGVCKGEIVQAIVDGNLGSTQEVVATTRAGAGCGSCKPTVTELLRITRGGQVEEATYLCPCRKQTREDLAEIARTEGCDSVTALSEACGAGRDCGMCKPGLAYLVSEVHNNQHREERHARFINDRVHANIQNDGTFSVVPRMRGGVTTADELRRIADVADKYEVPLIKVTGGQRIDLLGVKKEDLPAVWDDLDMPSGHAYAKSIRTVKTCVGEQFCRFGLNDSMGFGIEIEEALEGLYTPHKVKLAVSGCPRNCAESLIKDIGIVAIEGGWEIYVGGGGAGTIKKGELLTTVETKKEAMRMVVLFLQYYRENAEYLERTMPFVERVGLDEIKSIVTDPDSELAPQLLERFKIAKAASDPDPWKERHNPVHAKQFSELDSTPTLEVTK